LPDLPTATILNGLQQFPTASTIPSDTSDIDQIAFTLVAGKASLADYLAEDDGDGETNSTQISTAAVRFNYGLDCLDHGRGTRLLLAGWSA
jgi:hypothetical protein